jgi:hypothetical protein
LEGKRVRVRLVALKAWNITRFLFVTNRRREIAGASELITRLDREWVDAALGHVFPGFTRDWRIGEQPAELVEAGAGTVTVLVRDGADARAVVREVTLRALREAPGLDVFGVVGEPFEWDEVGTLAEATAAARGSAAQVRTSRPNSEVRFRRVPYGDECASTGLPAERLALTPGPTPEMVTRSAESQAKWDAYGRENEGDGLARLAEQAGVTVRDLKWAVRQLNDESSWVGVVFADVNDLGRAFEELRRRGRAVPNREYAEELQEFSVHLRRCIRESVREAAGRAYAAMPKAIPAVVPLVVGGDDLAVICDGQLSLVFAAEYVKAFERHTAADEVIARVCANQHRSRLTCAAGVAVVKAHFPFETAIRLAKALLYEEAKSVPGKAGSAVAFHVAYDSTEVELARIRATTSREPGVSLVSQPYLVSDPQVEGDRLDREWAAGRRWEDLCRQVAALSRRGEDGELALPASQMHSLREALFVARETADARFVSLDRRYAAAGLREMAADGDAPLSLFRRDTSGAYRTSLLDAMDAAGFLPAWIG